MRIKLLSIASMIFLVSCGLSENELDEQCEAKSVSDADVVFQGFSLKELEVLQINVADSPSDLHNRSIRLSDLQYTYYPGGGRFVKEPEVSVPINAHAGYAHIGDASLDYKDLEFEFVVESVDKSYFIKDFRMGRVRYPLYKHGATTELCMLASYSINDVLVDYTAGRNLHHFGNKIVITKVKE